MSLVIDTARFGGQNNPEQTMGDDPQGVFVRSRNAFGVPQSGDCLPFAWVGKFSVGARIAVAREDADRVIQDHIHSAPVVNDWMGAVDDLGPVFSLGQVHASEVEVIVNLV